MAGVTEGHDAQPTPRPPGPSGAACEFDASKGSTMGVVLWAACGLYVCVALSWLWLRGIGEGSTGRLDKAVAVSLVPAVGAFLVLMFIVDHPGGPNLPWWRLFR